MVTCCQEFVSCLEECPLQRVSFKRGTTVAKKHFPMVSGLAFYDDLNTRVSVTEATALMEIVRQEAEKILPGVTVTLTGGFRRWVVM